VNGVMEYRQERCLGIDGGINGNGMEVQLALALTGRRSVRRLGRRSESWAYPVRVGAAGRQLPCNHNFGGFHCA